MKLLVTGGAGFIGSNFIRYWLEKYPQDHITNLDKLTYAGNLENLKDIENNPNYSFVKGDICDKELVMDITKGMDLIVHFAAESHVDRSIEGPEEFVKTNVEGTLNLLEAALQNGNIRFSGRRCVHGIQPFQRRFGFGNHCINIHDLGTPAVICL